MRVKCIDNNPKSAEASHKYLGSNSGNNSPDYMLTVGKLYTVYAKRTIEAETMYLILDDAQHEPDKLVAGWGEPDPAWYDAKLFEVVDPGIDSIWQKVGYKYRLDKGELWSFPEFTERPDEFYHWLTEGRKEEVNIFLKYIKKYENTDG